MNLRTGPVYKDKAVQASLASCRKEKRPGAHPPRAILNSDYSLRLGLDDRLLDSGRLGCSFAYEAREALVDGFLRHVSDDLVGYFSALEEQKRRDPANAVAHRGSLVAIDVHLCNLQLARVLCGYFIDDRRERLTGSAPCSPEIDQNRLFGLQHLLIEGGITYFKNSVSRHVPPLWFRCSGLASR